ncbi:carboxynorspermidine decarboxylase [Carboxylicivirga sp. M1479]|uniref:carboxynorspermidine decarboxylase n=1 Tax=Carboxylicivirga sp. M1479 TaxID=2594476 RepID=UPI0011782AA5|nr:carboxynorspermidine decarboxylase [Carboxylicivirga sp. M1479]TRX65695.1 carboxynorspermidine decarboxylase [Carboxylicivirga sp. M1479]
MPIDYNNAPSPCYILDEQLFRKNLQLIKDVKEQAGIEIIMAFKAFSMWSAFPIVKEYIGKATASSIHEARLAFEEMGNKAHTYSPAYKEEEFKEILSMSSHITFNSLSQFNSFKTDINSTSDKVSVGLRINPQFSDVSTDLYNPCAPGSRLGIIASQLPKVLPSEIEGLHFHTLCESSSYDLENTLNAVEERFASYLKQVKWINMGGGHLMTRKDYDTQHLIKLLKQFKEKWDLQIILEPGSAFAWETGDLMSSVVDIVENEGIKTAILDVSFTAHMPDCLEMPYQPEVENSIKGDIEGKHTYRLGGNSCLAGDFMEHWSFDHELQIGEHIIFKDMIHYTMVKTTMFNGVPHPAIAIWNETEVLKVVKEFTYDDYKSRLS